MEPTYDRSNDELKWGDRIPFDDGPSPAAAPIAYRWLLDSGIPPAEARFRVYGWPPTGYARPRVAANAWRRQFSGDGAGRDGSAEWYEFHARSDERPSALAIGIVNEIMRR